jgi:hypothetical protein
VQFHSTGPIEGQLFPVFILFISVINTVVQLTYAFVAVTKKDKFPA